MSWYVPELTWLSKPMILVVGYGTLGRAVTRSLMYKGNAIVRAVDKNINTNLVPTHDDAIEGVIVCVDTPVGSDGHCDTTNVHDALNSIRAAYGAPHIMVKSTLPPDYVSNLPENAIYSPEFLRESNAFADFQSQPYMILGGDQDENKFWKGIFKYLGTKYVETTPEAASWTKYLHNTFLATKVAFFHDMDIAAYNLNDSHNFYEALGIISSNDTNVGASHLYAPNNEGGFGYGGKCFPKDMEAFANYTNSEFLKQVIEQNERLNKTRSRD